MKKLVIAIAIAILAPGCGRSDSPQAGDEQDSFNESLMTNCEACGKGISKQAESCPACGHPNPIFIASEKKAEELAEEETLKAQGGAETLSKIGKTIVEGRDRLYLDGREITDITPLRGLTNLKALSLQNNRISDLTPLAGLTNLIELQLYGNQISDLTPLAELKNLEMLFLSRNQIIDVTPLAQLKKLEELSLGKNPIIAVTPLAGLTNLTNLSLDGNITSADQKTVLRQALPKCKISF